MRKVIIPVVLLIAIFLVAFTPEKATVILEGKVLTESKALASAKVFVNKNTEANPGYFEPTLKDGSYRLQFNVKHGKPLDILYSKEGYTTIRNKFIASGKENTFQLNDVELLKLYDVRKHSAIDSPVLKVYLNEDQKEPTNINVKDILYFDLIKKSTLKQHLDQGDKQFYLVNFTLIDKETIIDGWISPEL